LFVRIETRSWCFQCKAKGGGLLKTHVAMMDEIVQLNVGGTYFTTTRATLCSEAGSMLAAKFSEENNFAPPLKDENGHVFLDRNPTYFAFLLDYLRLGCRLPQAPKDTDMLEAIKAEADYFGLGGLVAICHSLKDERDVGDR
jgi:hypothetical protein